MCGNSTQTVYDWWFGDRGAVWETGGWAGGGRVEDAEIFTGIDQRGQEMKSEMSRNQRWEKSWPWTAERVWTQERCQEFWAPRMEITIVSYVTDLRTWIYFWGIFLYNFVRHVHRRTGCEMAHQFSTHARRREVVCWFDSRFFCWWFSSSPYLFSL